MALRLAEELGAEIVSVDSMQVYRGMDIGTAKPDALDRARVRHHMIDLVDPEDAFSVADFQEHGRAVLTGLQERRCPALVVGGSGLHFRALVDPLSFPPHDPQVRGEIEALEPSAARAELVAADPEAGRFVDLENPRRVGRALEVLRLTGLTPSRRAAQPGTDEVAGYRPVVPFRAVGLDPGDELSDRVRTRLRNMIDAGLLEEVAGLAGRLGPTAAGAVGYRQLLPVVAGECDLDEGVEATYRATMSLAKRQRTFFRRDPRIDWVPWSKDGAERWAVVRRGLLEAA